MGEFVVDDPNLTLALFEIGGYPVNLKSYIMSTNVITIGKEETVTLLLLEKQAQLTADNEVIYYYTAYMQNKEGSTGFKASISSEQYDLLQEYVFEEVIAVPFSFDVKRRDNGKVVPINKCAINFKKLKRD